MPTLGVMSGLTWQLLVRVIEDTGSVEARGEIEEDAWQLEKVMNCTKSKLARRDYGEQHQLGTRTTWSHRQSSLNWLWRNSTDNWIIHIMKIQKTCRGRAWTRQNGSPEGESILI